MVTTERPKIEIERMEARRGIPFISFSTGMVASRSTSSAACPGKRVMTWTWTFVTSGYASTGSFR